MMKQTKHILFGLSLLAATAFTTSCESVLGDDELAQSDGNMELTFTRSGDSNSPTSGTLVFWKATMGDFFYREIDNLNDWSETKYNTGEPYPKNGALVQATGFSPASMQAWEVSGKSFNKLTLPDGATPGTVDVCTAEKIITGSYYKIFSETMRFEHTLTKITFKVQRDQTMVGSRDVKNIRITIPTKHLVTEWNWNEAKYVANDSQDAESTLSFAHPEIIHDTNTDAMGEAYLGLTTSNNGLLQDIQIEADILPIESTTVENHIDQTIDIPLNDASGNQVENALPGEAYEIIIKFQQNSFTLEARQSDWEKGGIIYVPVKP